MENKYVTINISDDSIKFLICKNVNGQTYVIGQLIKQVNWLVKGRITNLKLAIKEISAAKQELEEKAMFKIEKVFVVVPNVMAKLKNSIGTIDIDNANHLIDHQGYIKLLDQIKKQNSTSTFIPVTITPNRFFIDDSEVYEVIGHKGKKLTVEGTLISLPKKIFFDYLLVIEKSGLEIVDVVIEATADLYSNLKPSEYTKKVCMINLGNNITNVAVVDRGILKHLQTFDVGLNSIISAIQTKYDLDFKNAQRCLNAFMALNSITNREYVIENSGQVSIVKEIEVIKIINDILEVIYKGIHEYVKNYTVDVNSYIIYGNGARIQGINKFSEHYFNRQVKVNKVKLHGIRKLDMSSLIGSIEYIKTLEKDRIISEQNYISIIKAINQPKEEEMQEVTKESKFNFRNLFKRKDR